MQRRVNPKLYPVICPPESDLRNSLPGTFTQIKPVYGAGKVKGKGEMASFSLQSVRDGCHYVVIELNYCAEEGKGREEGLHFCRLALQIDQVCLSDRQSAQSFSSLELTPVTGIEYKGINVERIFMQLTLFDNSPKPSLSVPWRGQTGEED